MPKCTIPLWLVFTLQSLVVVGAFMAVIMVLVIQQQDQYTASVFREIGLQQVVTNTALTSPIVLRERSISQLASRLKFDSSLWFRAGDNLSSSSVQAFMNQSFFLMYQDPIAFAITQTRYDTTGEFFVSAAMSSDTTLAVQVSNFSTQVAPNPTYPLQFTTTITVPYVNDVDYVLLASPIAQWSNALVFNDILTSDPKFITSLLVPIEFSVPLGLATTALVLVVDIHYLVGLASEAILTPTTQALLIGRQYSDVLASVNVDGASTYDEDNSKVWSLTTFPVQSIVQRYQATDVKCLIVSNCSQYAVEDGENIVSLLHLTTDYALSMSFYQITPRDHYFADGDRATAVGIAIGVVAAVLVLLSCVLIWFAIRRPIQKLRDNMLLAAVMRNDEVVETDSLLSELELLSQSFTQMNDKLLQARAFMPQALLCGTDDGDDEEEANVEDSLLESSILQQRRVSTQMSEMSRSGTRSESMRTSTSSHIQKQRSAKYGVVHTNSTALVPKTVGVLMINARGTHGLVAKGSARSLEAEQVRLVELVERCSRAERGVVDAFQGDHFTVTFNAARAVGSPARGGALVSLALEDAAQRDGLVLGQFSMGLSVGRAFVGNVGSATMKKSCIVGNVYTDASRLEALAKRLKRTCLVDGRCIRDLDHIVYCMLLGTAQLSSDVIDVAGCIVSSVEGSNGGGGGEEWLYQIQGEKVNPYSEYNDVMETYMKSGVDAARSGFDALKLKFEDDATPATPITPTSTLTAFTTPAATATGFLPTVAVIEHLTALFDRHVKIEGMGKEELAVLHIGNQNPFGVDFDMR